MMTCGEAAEFLQLAAERLPEMCEGITASVVGLAAVRAKGYIGEDQGDWEPLSPATLDGFRHLNGTYIPGKIELGFSPPDNPLLRTGDLRDSIEAEVIDPFSGIVGSTSLKGLWQEMGTEGAQYPIPPRPFISKGLLETVPEAETLIEESMMALLTPGEI
jgi:hypothetical protein